MKGIKMTAPTGRLAGKKVIVTAAAQGIGRAIAERFVQEGAQVHGCDINEAELAKAAAAGIHTHLLDCSDGAAVAATFAQIGPVDVLAHAVGWVCHGSVLETAPEDWNRSFRLNVDSMYHAVRAVLPGMVKAQNGSIIAISSIVSSLKGFPNRAAYGATKAAVLGLTKSIAADFVGQGIRCNAICPGTVESPSLQARINAFDDPVAARAAFIARQPMGRLGTPEEIAALALYLASDESAYMSGTAAIIDGCATN